MLERAFSEVLDAINNGMTVDDALDSAFRRWEMTIPQCEQLADEVRFYMAQVEPDDDYPDDDDWDAYVVANALGPDE